MPNWVVNDCRPRLPNVPQEKNVPLHDLRLASQTLTQRILIVVSLLFMLHFTVGTGLWLLFIWSQTVIVARNSSPAQLAHNLGGWLPFFSRIWKSTTPLGLSIVSAYLIPYRPKLSIGLLVGVAAFSMLCAWHDISTEQYDLTTFGPPWGGHMNHYFTWWWCKQRPS